MRTRTESGFTLIELMIVVVVIAILAAIAYPSYTKQVHESRRTACKGDVMDLAASLENYRARQFSYQNAAVADLSPTLAHSKYYTVTLALSNHNQAWEIKALPKGGMAGDGVLRLNSKGQSCWGEGSATCVLSDSSSWTAD